MRKDKGSAMDMIQILIGLLIVVIVVIFGISYSSVAIKRTAVEMIAHNYLLKMETEGYLTSDDKKSLEKDLQDMGIKNINITNSSCSPVGYGETITLSIKGNLTLNVFVVDSFDSGFTNHTYNIDITKTTTSKAIELGGG